MLKKNSVAEAVATDMAGIMDSDEYRSIFAKPVVSTQVAPSDETVESEPKTSKLKRFELVVQGMAKMSEVLDELGLTDSSVSALNTLESIVREAAHIDDPDHWEDEECEADEDEDHDDESGESDESDDNDGSAKSVPSIPLPGSSDSAAGKYQGLGHHTKAPAQQKVPGAGYSAPSRSLNERALPSGKPRGQSADDSGSHASAIDVGVKEDTGMADDELEHQPPPPPPLEVKVPEVVIPSGSSKMPAYPPAPGAGMGKAPAVVNLPEMKVTPAGPQETYPPKGASKDLQTLLTALGLNTTASASKKGKKDQKDEKKDEKKKGKKDDKDDKDEKKKGKKEKKAWYHVEPSELLAMALDYEDYDHSDLTEEMAAAFDDIRQNASFSRDGRILAFASAKKEKGSFIFPSTHPKVKSGDHFPIDTEGRARNALARVNQFSKAPTWWTGSLKELVNGVVKAVKTKYKGIEVSKKSKTPGKG